MTGVTAKKVEAAEEGLRLDRWFRRHYPDLPFGQLARLTRKGQIRLDGGRVKTNTRLLAGQTIRIPPDIDKARPQTAQIITSSDKEFMRSLVIYRDNHVIALNKPHGLAVQGGTKTTRHIDAMLDALRFEATERPRLVHRLDRDTSGVLLLGRSASSAAFLSKSFQRKIVDKTYWGLCVGAPRPARGVINLSLAKRRAGSAEEGRERVTPVKDNEEGAQRAVTSYAVMGQAAQKAAWLALKPLTGRTHQLRVHLQAIGHPLVGDGKYGGVQAAQFLGAAKESRLHLHARALVLDLPSGKSLTVTAPLPPHMAETWDFFEFNPDDDSDPFEEF